jgi:hypothetical protein
VLAPLNITQWDLMEGQFKVTQAVVVEVVISSGIMVAPILLQEVGWVAVRIIQLPVKPTLLPVLEAARLPVLVVAGLVRLVLVTVQLEVDHEAYQD